MHSDPTRDINTETDRERSRSPLGVRSTSTATTTLGRRSRKRSFDWEQFRAETAARHAAWDAEEKRRKELTPEERLKEGGGEKLLDFERDPHTIILLQETPDHGNRGGCRAYPCLKDSSANIRNCKIHDTHRILVDTGRSYDRRHYYHLECFLCMGDVARLTPLKFRMQGGPGQWGLMVRKWFQHHGCIDLKKLEDYIKRREEYEKPKKAFDMAHIDWCLNHSKTCKDRAEEDCTCPQEPEPPVEPRLEGYTTAEDQKRGLLEVLRHPQAEALYGGLSMTSAFMRPAVLLPEMTREERWEAMNAGEQ